MREEQLLAYLKGACLGRRYRVSGAELEAALGVSGTDLRKMVNRLRRLGVPVGSDRQGYFYAATASEVYSGAPTQAQRSGLRGERRSDGASELFAVRRKRASAVRDDDRQLRQMVTGLEGAIAGLEAALEHFREGQP